MVDEHQTAHQPARWCLRVRPALVPLLAATGAGTAPPRPAIVVGAVSADPGWDNDRAAPASRERQHHFAGRPPRCVSTDDGRPHGTDAAYQAQARIPVRA